VARPLNLSLQPLLLLLLLFYVFSPVSEAGQSHLFDGWKVGADVEKKRAFFEQVSTLEKNYPGGSLAYTKNAQELLRSSAAGENPFEGMAPEVRVFTSL